MSIETWKKEFYPVPAHRRMTDGQAVAHSLKKWSGLTKKNLDKHKLMIAESYITSSIIEDSGLFSKSLEIASRTCALCLKGPCSMKCPLHRHLGHPCDSGFGTKRSSSRLEGRPYSVWILIGNAEPMIKALKGTMKMLKLKQLLLQPSNPSPVRVIR